MTTGIGSLDAVLLCSRLGSTQLSRCAVVIRFLLTILKEVDVSASFWLADKRHASQIL